MQNPTQLEQLLKALETLIANNKELTQINAHAFELVKARQFKEKKILARCAHLYQTLQSKNTKTTAEEECLLLFHELIASEEA